MKWPARKLALALLVLAIMGTLGPPVAARAAPITCSASSTSATGHALVSTTVSEGAAPQTIAEFTPRFVARLTPAPDTKLPEPMKPDGEPAAGVFPAAKFSFQYSVTPDGHRTLPLYRFDVEVPVRIGGEQKSAYVHVKIGAWEGGKLVSKRDISGIVGLPDVPIYAVGWQLKAAAPRDAEPETTGLDVALKQSDHADVEVHEGGASGPLVASGQVNLSAYADRAGTVVSALDAMGAKFNDHSCGPGS